MDRERKRDIEGEKRSEMKAERERRTREKKKKRWRKGRASGRHWEGKADGVWHTPHAIIME